MHHQRHVLVALGCCAAIAPCVVAQTPRQAERQERREARQDIRANNQDIRANNRGAYFSDQTWTQLNPWLTRNQVQPGAASRAGAAVDAAANTAQRAANAAPTQLSGLPTQVLIWLTVPLTLRSVLPTLLLMRRLTLPIARQPA